MPVSADERPTLIVRAGQLVTHMDAGVWSTLDDGAVLVEAGRVAEIGHYDAIRALRPDVDVVGSRDHVALPGLVNAHHHGLGLTSFQLGVLDRPLETWMLGLHAALLRMRDPYLDTQVSNLALLRSGVTTVAHVGYTRRPEACVAEVEETMRAHRDTGIRVRYAVNFRDRFRFAYEDDDRFLASLPKDVRAVVDQLPADDGDALVEDLFDVYGRLHASADERVAVMLAAEGPEWCTDPLLERLRERATADRVPLHVHAVESPIQRDAMERLYGESTIEHLARLEFLQDDTALAHAIWMNRRDIEICAERGVTVCHNPSSNLRLRNGIAPVHAYRSGGVHVAIGSDSTSFDDRDDYFHELRLAQLLHRLPAPGSSVEDAPALSSDDVLDMSLRSGARAVGLAGEIGELTPGSWADVVLLRSNDLEGTYVDPAIRAVDKCVYRGDARCVDAVLVAGNVVVEDGRCLTIDEEAVVAARARRCRSTTASLPTGRAPPRRSSPFSTSAMRAGGWSTPIPSTRSTPSRELDPSGRHPRARDASVRL